MTTKDQNVIVSNEGIFYMMKSSDFRLSGNFGYAVVGKIVTLGKSTRDERGHKMQIATMENGKSFAVFAADWSALAL